MARISLALAGLTTCLLLAAHLLGLFPDREAAVVQGRKTLSEMVAIHGSLAVQREDLPTIEAAMQALVQRNPDIVSAAVRKADGKLVAAIGDHAPWSLQPGQPSTPEQMYVPILRGEKPWGSVELRFRPLQANGPGSWLAGPLGPLVAFFLVAGFLAIYLYLRASLRHADRSQAQAVPERVRDTLNTVVEGVLVLDKHERIALANDAFARSVGLSPLELQGRKASELPWSRSRAQQRGYPWMQALHHGSRQLGVILGLRTKEAGVRKMSVNSTTILADDGTCRGALATFDDLTSVETKNRQLRQLLLRLKRSRKKIYRQKQALHIAKRAADAANRAKSEFIANVSHEIRTPMNAIMGMTDAARESPAGPQQREYLDIVKVSADSLLTIINDILDFSKMEAGKIELDPVDFALRDQLDDTLKTLALRVHQNGLELACDVRADVPEALHGDPGRLRQILVNLVGNAVKFTAQGEVVVRVQVEQAGADEVLLHFAVSDTGIGIPADKLRAIFEPFTQADGSTTRKYGGTGLGLTISLRLVELMGGRIWVDSEVGRGSTFHFTARFGLRPATRTVRPDLAPLRDMPVLVVDDSATCRSILNQTLTDWHMQPVLAADDVAALAELQRADETGERFPIVLVDATLPETDVFALMEEMKWYDSTGTIILLLSTNDLAADTARCREAGVTAQLTKPVRNADLLRALGKALGAALVPETAVDGRADAGDEEALPCLRVLLVDDNLFNRKVGTLKLEKQGQRVQSVASGREAIAALEKGPFDLVFMDVQMPEMDGLETTARIRRKEAESGGHVPIIAMTGRAMKGDREMCLQAGMDGYVTKPIQDRELRRALGEATVLLRRDAAAVTCDEVPVPATLDRSALLARVGGNEALLQDLLAVFRDDSTRLLNELRQAHAAGDAAAVQQAAHTLKGMVGFFDMPAALEAAVQLETLGRQGDLAGAANLLLALEREIERIGTASATLERLPPPAPAHADAPPDRDAGSSSAPANALDEQTLLGRAGGSWQLLHELVTVFQHDSGRLQAEMREALDAGDGKRLHEAAHALKGMVSFFDVAAATESIVQLEGMGRQEDLSGAHEILTRLNQQIEALLTALAELNLGPAPPPPAVSQPAPAAGGLEPAALLARVGGNATLLQELLIVFRSDSLRLLAEARQALAQDDAAGLYQAAHTLKGMASFFEVPAVDAAALELETLAGKQALARAGEVLVRLAGHIAFLQTDLPVLCPRSDHEDSGGRG
jgi:two-component system, sensor histidine kinase and response regulator